MFTPKSVIIRKKHFLLDLKGSHLHDGKNYRRPHTFSLLRRFNIRIVLLVTTICALFFAWLNLHLKWIEKRRQARLAFEQLNAFILYEHQEFTYIGSDPPSHKQLLTGEPAPKQLVRWFGVDSFLWYVDIELDGSKVNDEVLSHIQYIPELEHLRLSNTSITNSGLKYLVNARNLRHLEM